ncbi:MAG TPA: helix-turn-helix transcriptional regulator [Vicinamibacterales bacterium]|nr:helix-turn-helix transcriptional regulator [Vicinamibacterales bacterium]
MAKSDLLRLQDLRDAYRLIGDCRDLGGDPVLWHPQMLEGLCRLIGTPAAVGGEGRWIRPHHDVEPISAFEAGLDSHGRDVYGAYHRDIGPAGDPIFRALQHVPGRLVTRTRRQLVPDAVYYRSAVFNEYLRLGDIDHRLVSVCQVSDDDAISVIHLQRAPGERDFSPREQRLLNFFHEELGRLIGRSLVSALEPNPEKLSPRLRQTLGCLLEGDSEKQVAARLGLSQATTHQYVMALYRRFGVRSRAQLLVYVMKRTGVGLWRQPPAAS